MNSPLLTALRDVLVSDGIRQGEDIPARNRADSAGYEPTLPIALVLPRSTEEVSAVLALCNEYGQAVVPQGGLTGLVYGAHPGADEIAISLERMSGVEQVDRQSSTLTALAGTPLQVIQEAAEVEGLMVGIDLGARGTCTIGGNVATNAGGNQVLRYGMTRRNVLGLEAVLADGRVVRSLNKMLKNNAGYDWTQLFIGSEGTLGIVTRVTLMLHPRPTAIDSALVSVASTQEAITLLRDLGRALPSGLLTFEAMWRDFYRIAVEDIGFTAPLPVGQEVYLLIEAPSAGDELLVEALSAEMEEGCVQQAVIARSEADRLDFWAVRESVYEYGEHFPPMITFDISVPLDLMADAVRVLRTTIETSVPGAPWVVFGHLADSNIHVNAMPEPSIENARKLVEVAVYNVVKEFGGSVSAEHGIGRMKAAYLPLSRTSAEMELMARMKRALDPKGILSPGRIF